MRNLSFNLSTGILNISLKQERISFDKLLVVHERINPKRSFIFASKVLGRYYPSKLNTLQQTASTLIRQVPKHLFQGNVTSISVADSGLLLGCALNRHIRNNQIQSFNDLYTTHVFKGDTNLVAHFVESHSHTPDKYLYVPKEKLESYQNTDTLILIDDEVTSGNTLKNLVSSLNLPNVKRIIVLTIADWSNESLAFGDIPSLCFSLLNGSYSWAPNGKNLKDFPQGLEQNIQSYYGSSKRKSFIQVRDNLYIIKPGSEVQAWSHSLKSKSKDIQFISASFSPVIFKDTMVLEDGTFLYNSQALFKKAKVKSYG